MGKVWLRAITRAKQLKECTHNRDNKEALGDGFNEAIDVHDANNGLNINVRNAENVVKTLMEPLGLEGGHVDKEGAVSTIIDTYQHVPVTYSNTLVQSVTRTRLE